MVHSVSVFIILALHSCLFYILTQLLLRPIAHDPSYPSKLLVPESRTRNFANLSCILLPDLSGTRNLDRELGLSSIGLTSSIVIKDLVLVLKDKDPSFKD